jgi:hypothetical protein
MTPKETQYLIDRNLAKTTYLKPRFPYFLTNELSYYSMFHVALYSFGWVRQVHHPKYLKNER